jgi:exodeoxyribonuclease VII large subunit
MPAIPVILYPTLVQGEGAAQQIVSALRAAGQRRECQVLILCRGGGSIEDLWCFNEEAVARAIRACPIPVVTGVGHETDFTIADFVADARAPTPTGAAALVCPDRTELRAAALAFARRMARSIRHALDQRVQQSDFLARRLVHPGQRIEAQARQLQHLNGRLQAAMQRSAHSMALPLARAAHRLQLAAPDCARLNAEQRHLRQRLTRAAWMVLERRSGAVARLASHLQHLDPRQVLERGFSIVRRADGSIVRDARVLERAERVALEFARGAAQARIDEIDG